jgi:hypothetical protein
VRRPLVAWFLLLFAWPLVSPTFCENVKCRGAKGLLPRTECVPENASEKAAPSQIAIAPAGSSCGTARTK